MATHGTDWKTWLLGALFTIVMVTGGAVVAGQDNRIATLEKEKDAAIGSRQEMAVQVALLQQNQEQMKQRLEEFRVEFREKQDEMLSKINIILNGMTQNSKRWNAEMDRFSRAFADKK